MRTIFCWTLALAMTACAVDYTAMHASQLSLRCGDLCETDDECYQGAFAAGVVNIDSCVMCSGGRCGGATPIQQRAGTVQACVGGTIACDPTFQWARLLCTTQCGQPAFCDWYCDPFNDPLDPGCTNASGRCKPGYGDNLEIDP